MWAIHLTIQWVHHHVSHISRVPHFPLLHVLKVHTPLFFSWWWWIYVVFVAVLWLIYSPQCECNFSFIFWWSLSLSSCCPSYYLFCCISFSIKPSVFFRTCRMFLSRLSLVDNLSSHLRLFFGVKSDQIHWKTMHKFKGKLL